MGQNPGAVQSVKAQGAPEYVAIPVREAPEPGERLQPLPLSAPTPVSSRYAPTEEGDVWHTTVQQLIAAEAITALVRELALASGSIGMAGGQAIDLGSVGLKLDQKALEYMHRHKTGALIEVSN